MEITGQCDSLDCDDEIFEAIHKCGDTMANPDTHAVEELHSTEELREVVYSKPCVGLEFDSLDKAYYFYNQYARIVGFSVRKGKVRKSNINGSFLFRRFCCSKEGHPRKICGNDNDESKQVKDGVIVKVGAHIQSLTRVGCNAKLDVKKMTNGRWVVQKFHEEHNHECAHQEETHLLRSHRRIKSTQGQVIDTTTCSKPYVGLEFDSLDKAYVFYNEYARVVGFSVRKAKIRKSNIDGSILFRRLCCSKEGHCPKNCNNDSDKPKQAKVDVIWKVGVRTPLVTRVGCNAKLDLKRMSNGRWIVQKFHEEHNHECARQGEKHLLRSQRCKQSTQGQLIGTITHSSTIQQNVMAYLTGEAGGSEKVHFIEQSLKNQMSERRRNPKVEDIEVILGYFKQMQTTNPSFFSAIQGYEDGRMSNFFWADERSRVDFGCFGDVIYFDSTYGSNKFGRPFAPIVGVNHHLQPVLFGCAILFNETEESFSWLLEMLLKAMSGHHPVAIITNQNAAMAKAIERVLPRTHHSLCLWHVFQNAAIHLSHLHGTEDSFRLSTEFKNCIYEPLCCGEFEARWGFLLDKYKLHNNEWFDNMYKKRHKWAPVYLRHIFHADMTTTERAESINSFFTGYLNKSLPLSEFLEQYDMALVSRREKETYEDFKSHQTRPVLKLDLPMEQQAADVYTRSVFKEFHKEFCHSFRYIASETERAGTNRTYVVSILGQNRNCLVNFNSSINDFQLNCSCQKFELTGILCRHILKVFTVTNVMLIPEVYIKRRWTKKAKCGVFSDERVREVQADYLKLLGNVAGEEKIIIQPDIDSTRSLHLPAEVSMHIGCSNHLVIEEIQTFSSADQEILHNTTCVKTEGQPPKRNMSSLDKNQGEKKSRVEHKSSKHNEAPSLSRKEGVGELQQKTIPSKPKETVGKKSVDDGKPHINSCQSIPRQ